MTRHSKRTPRKPATPFRSAPRRRSKTKALAISDAIRREPLAGQRLLNPLSMLEPLRQRIVEQQIEFLGAALVWSPAHVIIGQQAAFWDGFVGGTRNVPPRGKPQRKRAKAR